MSIMMVRKIAIGLAAAAIAMGGATLNASAMRGGGGGGGHGGGGMNGGMVSGPHGGGGRYAMGDRYRRDHDRGRYGYRYYRYGGSYGGSCWRWTPEGRIWVCGGGYGYGDGGYGYRYRYGWRGRHHSGHFGGALGMHGGGGHGGGGRR